MKGKVFMSEVEQWNEIREQLALLRETIENCEKIQNIIETCIPENITDRYVFDFLLH